MIVLHGYSITLRIYRISTSSTKQSIHDVNNGLSKWLGYQFSYFYLAFPCPFLSFLSISFFLFPTYLVCRFQLNFVTKTTTFVNIIRHSLPKWDLLFLPLSTWVSWLWLPLKARIPLLNLASPPTNCVWMTAEPTIHVNPTTQSAKMYAPITMDRAFRRRQIHHRAWILIIFAWTTSPYSPHQRIRPERIVHLFSRLVTTRERQIILAIAMQLNVGCLNAIRLRLEQATNKSRQGQMQHNLCHGPH